jgi:rod shape-determining protein MreC
MLKVKTKNNIFMFVAVIGLLIFLHFLRILAPIERAITYFITPTAEKIYSVGTDLRTVVNEQTDKRDLLSVVKNLEVKLNQLTIENSQLKTIGEENEKLRQQLKFFAKSNVNYTLANVISRGALDDSLDQGQAIIIDKGKRDGFFAGLGVLNSQGVIVGKIMEVKENISKVCLVTNKGCKLAASIQGQNDQRTSGVVEGDLGLTIKMDFIPQTEKIKVDDIVITSGLENDIPEGLVIGKIIQVDSNSNEIWQKATVESLMDLGNLTIVSIISPTTQ